MGDGGQSSVLTAVGDGCTAADDARGGAADLAGGGCRVFLGLRSTASSSTMAKVVCLSSATSPWSSVRDFSVYR